MSASRHGQVVLDAVDIADRAATPPPSDRSLRSRERVYVDPHSANAAAVDTFQSELVFRCTPMVRETICASVKRISALRNSRSISARPEESSFKGAEFTGPTTKVSLLSLEAPKALDC